MDGACEMSDVLRWMVDQYRVRLYESDPRLCRLVDEIMIRVGQGWVCDDGVVDLNELMTAQDIERRHGISLTAIRKIALRNGVEVRGKRGKWNLYRLGDILSARAKKNL